MDHPRWGLIQSLIATRNIKAGEELYAHYGYSTRNFPSDFPWYWELKMKVDKENRMITGRNKK